MFWYFYITFNERTENQQQNFNKVSSMVKHWCIIFEFLFSLNYGSFHVSSIKYTMLTSLFFVFITWTYLLIFTGKLNLIQSKFLCFWNLWKKCFSCSTIPNIYLKFYDFSHYLSFSLWIIFDRFKTSGNYYPVHLNAPFKIIFE